MPETDGLTLMERAKLQEILERNRALRFKTDRLEGKLHNAEQCRADKQRADMSLKAELLKTVRELAPKLTGQSAAQIQVALEAAVCVVLNARTGEEQDVAGTD